MAGQSLLQRPATKPTPTPTSAAVHGAGNFRRCFVLMNDPPFKKKQWRFGAGSASKTMSRHRAANVPECSGFGGSPGALCVDMTAPHPLYQVDRLLFHKAEVVTSVIYEVLLSGCRLHLSTAGHQTSTWINAYEIHKLVRICPCNDVIFSYYNPLFRKAKRYNCLILHT